MKPDRPKQEVPLDLVNDLMHVVKSQFYADAPIKQWLQDQHFIKIRTVLFPASWLNQRGVTLSPERYRAILIDIFTGIKQHGSTGVVKYWPGYLAHCVQEHFKVHGEEYYEEGKTLRTKLERLQLAFTRAAAAPPPPDPVQGLAEVHRVLVGHQRRKKAIVPRQQLGLL